MPPGASCRSDSLRPSPPRSCAVFAASCAQSCSLCLVLAAWAEMRRIVIVSRVRVSLESTGLIRFFEPSLFSASDVGQAGARSVPARSWKTVCRTGCLHRGGGFAGRRGRRSRRRHDGDWLCRCKPHRQPDRRSTARRRCPRDYLRPAPSKARSSICAAGRTCSALTRLRRGAGFRFRGRFFLFLLRAHWIEPHIHHVGVDIRGGLGHRE